MSGAKLTEAESVVMRCIWNYEKEEIPFLTLIEELKDKYGKDYKRTTVRTFLFDLEAKGYAVVERRGKFSYVKPVVKKDDYKKVKAEEVLDIWFDGSAKKFISALSERISEDEGQKLDKLLDELDAD